MLESVVGLEMIPSHMRRSSKHRLRAKIAIAIKLMGGLEPQTIGSYVWLRAANELPDGGVPDGGTEPGESSSGCSCRVVGPSDHDTGFVLALLAFGAWYWRRRRAS